MRTIKFRAWDNENNCYFEPTYEAYKGNLEELLIGMRGNLDMRTMTKFIHESIFPDRFILEQFTGLQDKNGKDIYEGDIVKWKWMGENIAVVEFGNGCFHPKGWTNESLRNYDIKVIGNIHENPESL